MKSIWCHDNIREVLNEPDPAIPDADIWVRFRSLIDTDTRITSDEIRETLDTRYLQPLLYFWARTIHARTIVEIGAGLGGTTLPLLKAAAEMGGTLHSIDTNHRHQPYATNIARRYGLQDTFVAHEMTSDHFFATSGQALTIDFAFVDGDHVCDAVQRDARNVMQRLTPGGIAVFHEYDLVNTPPYEQIGYLPEAGIYPIGRGRTDGEARLHTQAGAAGTPRALRRVLSEFDVDTMPLDFGACGVDRIEQWTEAGAIAVRKRRPGEFRVRET